jgi:selenocysteine lyase/cysteine desulfurase
MKRREFIAFSAGLISSPAFAMPQNHDDWSKIAALYPKHLEKIINLEYGGFGQMPLLVQEKFTKYSEKINREGTYFTRREFYPYYQKLREKIAQMVNAAPDEIAITRNATESMQSLIIGFNGLKSGDAVLYSDHDYENMQTVMEWLKIRRGVDVIKISLPYPATFQNLIDTYEAAFKANPKIRMVLLTHLSHRDGLVLPIKEIIELARQNGIYALVDSAKALGLTQIDVKAQAIDFAGFNLHKWVGAPLGVGALYIKKDKIDLIDRFLGEIPYEKDPISSRIHTGTANYAAQMAAIDAIDLHNQIGMERINKRLKYLRGLWVEPLKTSKKSIVITPDDDRLNAGISSFRLIGDNSAAAHNSFLKKLLDEYNIFSVIRTGLNDGACIRITPGINSTEKDMLTLAKALY